MRVILTIDSVSFFGTAIMPQNFFLIKYQSRNVVFKENKDYLEIETLMKELHNRYEVKIIYWCTIPNSLRILASSCNINQIRHFIQHMMTTFTKRYHVRHTSEGTLWKGGPTIQNIENHEYSIRTMQEISRIPVELKLIKIFDRWKWEKSEHILEKKHEESLSNYKNRFIKHLEHQNLPIGEISWIEQQLQISGWEPPKTRGRPRQPK